MGYTTDFNGEFNLDRPLHPKMREFLEKFSRARHMKRDVNEERYGKEGEFYVEDDETEGIIEFNQPPSTQPGLWCQWEPNEEGDGIRWDGGEKFYKYIEWIEYIVKKILAPNNYILNGEVLWQGEDMQDRGKIFIKDNVITMKELE